MAIRPDLETAKAVQDYVRKHGEGSAAEYLRLRQEEIEAEEEKQREEGDYEKFRHAYVSQGGTPASAREEYEKKVNEKAAKAAREADEAALAYSRSRMRSVL
jgi:hypothetical protein